MKKTYPLRRNVRLPSKVANMLRAAPARRALSLMGGGGGETAKAAAAAARAAGSETPGLELPWEAGKAVYRKLLRSVMLARALFSRFALYRKGKRGRAWGQGGEVLDQTEWRWLLMTPFSNMKGRASLSVAKTRRHYQRHPSRLQRPQAR